MVGCKLVCVSPNRPNMFYEFRARCSIENDLEHLVVRLREYRNEVERVIIYCTSLNQCADLYEYFHLSLGELS